jgi:hypothetical protein
MEPIEGRPLGRRVTRYAVRMSQCNVSRVRGRRVMDTEPQPNGCGPASPRKRGKRALLCERVGFGPKLGRLSRMQITLRVGPDGPRALVILIFLTCVIAAEFVIAGMLSANAAVPVHHFARVSMAKFSPAIRIKFIGVSDLAINKDEANVVRMAVIGNDNRINIDLRGSAKNHLCSRWHNGFGLVKVPDLKNHFCRIGIIIGDGKHRNVLSWDSSKITNCDVSEKKILTSNSHNTARLYSNISPQFPLCCFFSMFDRNGA